MVTSEIIQDISQNTRNFCQHMEVMLYVKGQFLCMDKDLFLKCL